MFSQKEVFELLRELGFKYFIRVPQLFFKVFKDSETAIFVAQLLFWMDKGKEDGWFWKPLKDWEEELGLSEFQVRRIRKELEEQGLLETKLKKEHGAPILHWRIKEEALLEFLLERSKETSETSPTGETKETSPHPLETSVSMEPLKTLGTNKIGHNKTQYNASSKKEEEQPQTALSLKEKTKAEASLSESGTSVLPENSLKERLKERREPSLRDLARATGLTAKKNPQIVSSYFAEKWGRALPRTKGLKAAWIEQFARPLLKEFHGDVRAVKAAIDDYFAGEKGEFRKKNLAVPWNAVGTIACTAFRQSSSSRRPRLPLYAKGEKWLWRNGAWEDEEGNHLKERGNNGRDRYKPK